MKKVACFFACLCFGFFTFLVWGWMQKEEPAADFVITLPGSSLDGLGITTGQAMLLAKAPLEAKNNFFEGYFLGLAGEDCQMAVDKTLDYFARLTAQKLVVMGEISEDDVSNSVLIALEAADLAEKFCLAGRRDKGKGLDFQADLITFFSN